MGKTKNKKFKTPKPQPTGLQSVRDFEAELDQESGPSGDNSTVQSLVEKLSSTNEEERECACTGIAGLVSQSAAITALLKQNVIKILSPLVLDSSIQVRHRALGALRNLSVDGGIDVCEEMVKRDVLTSIVALYKQFETDWIPEKTASKNNRDLKSGIFTEATHLLWNLCEASETAVDVFNKEELIHRLWPCLQYQVYGINEAITVAQCLHAVTENNEKLSVLCRENNKLSVLQEILSVKPDSTSLILLKILATGILININGAQIAAAAGSVVMEIIECVSLALDVDAAPMIKSVLSNKQLSTEGDIKAVKEYEHEITENLQEVEHLINAQLIAVEIVTNLCCSEDDWEEMADSESSSDDASGLDFQMEDENENSVYSPLCVPSEVQSAIVSKDIFNKVLNKAQPLDIEVNLDTTVKRKSILKSIERLQTHALLCTHNMVSSMECEALGGIANLHIVWQGLVTLTTNKQVVDNTPVLEAVTSAMRAVVQKLAEFNSPKLTEVTPTDLQFLFEMCVKCTSPEIRVNAVRIVSTIACLFAKIQEPHPMLKDVGNFLLEIACNDKDLWVVAEALDAVFDVFGEDHLNPIILEIRLIDRLKPLASLLKTKMKTNRHELGEHFPVISTARTNLIRFIKYKASL